MKNSLTAAAALASLALLDSLVHAAPESSPPRTLQLEINRRTNGPVASPRMRKRDHASSNIVYDGSLYYINFTLGTPGQPMAAYLDTGSSDLWVPDLGGSICDATEMGCGQLGGFLPRRSSSFNELQSDGFQIAYDSGDEIVGEYGQDVIKVAGTTIDDMIFGVAESGKSESPVNGIFGIGYPADESIVSNAGSDPYPNLISQLYKTGAVSAPVYSLWLNDMKSGQGNILFGGVDTDKFEGELGIVPIQKNAQTDLYDTFTIVLSGLTFSDSNAKSSVDIGGSLPVILDSGTTLTYLPDRIAHAIWSGLGIEYNDELGGPLIPCNINGDEMKFTFTFGSGNGVDIVTTLDQFVLPVYTDGSGPVVDGVEMCLFGLLSTGDIAVGQDDILFGDTFLRSAYVLYDLGNNQIGLAQTKFDASSSNVKDVSGPNGQQAISDYQIPQASTVANAVSVSQANGLPSGQRFGPTPTPNGNGDAGGIASPGKPTFAGLSGGLPTGNSKNDDDNAAMRASGAVDAAAVACGVAAAGLLLGGGLFAVF